jgi:hypothetical protein
MRQLQYLIRYEYMEKTGGWGFAHTFSTDSFISFLIHFLWLRHRYKVIDIEYRDKDF